tara:strand:- start:1382 stop:1573 length:192 start_codon:yes stop_codon:yes gene_type:complete
MMLKLWTLRNAPGGTLVKKLDGTPYHFEDKVSAKAIRDKLNAAKANGATTGIVVSHGPDHKLA